MSTTQSTDENFLLNPRNRWAISLSSAIVLVVVAVLLLDGTMRWLVLGIAVLNVVVEPKILEMAAEQESE